MNRKLRVGVIGVGGIAESHIAGYRRDPRAELCAFCDINEARLLEKGKRHGVSRLYTDVREMAKREELDAVSVCTWNAAHAPCTITALEAGWHVLCEKPMAINTAEAMAMQTAAAQNGRLLMIGFVRRFGNDCAAVEAFRQAGLLGDLYYAKATFLRRNGSPGGWFGDKARSGGGPLIDLGVHVIDLMRYLMGNPEPVSVYGAAFDRLGDRPGIQKGIIYQSAEAGAKDPFNVEDFASAMIRLANGAVLSVETSFSLHTEQDKSEIGLFGTKGGVKLCPELHLYTDMAGYMTNTTVATHTALNFDGLFEREIQHFVSCAAGEETACRAPAADGVTLMRILDAIYVSAQSGHEVVLD